MIINITLEELGEMRNDHKKNKRKEDLVVGNSGEFPVIDMGYIFFFFNTEEDSFVKKNWVTGEVEKTSYKMISSYRNEFSEKITNQEKIISEQKTFTGGIEIDRKNRRVVSTDEEYKALFWIDVVSLNPKEREYWTNVIRRIQKARLFDVYKLSDIEAQGRGAKNCTGETGIVVYKNIYLWYKREKDGKVKTQLVDKHVEKSAANDRTIAKTLAENLFSNKLDPASFIEMEKLDREEKCLYYESSADIGEKPNIAKTAKTLKMHKSTLYKVLKEDKKKFECYIKAAKGVAVEEILKATSSLDKEIKIVPQKIKEEKIIKKPKKNIKEISSMMIVLLEKIKKEEAGTEVGQFIQDMGSTVFRRLGIPLYKMEEISKEELKQSILKLMEEKKSDGPRRPDSE